MGQAATVCNMRKNKAHVQREAEVKRWKESLASGIQKISVFELSIMVYILIIISSFYLND